MCGRYILNLHSFSICDLTGIDRGDEDVAPSQNIAPTEKIAVVQKSDEKLRIDAGTFGYETGWRNGPPFLINLKIETIHEKNFARESLQTRRCVLPASGFLEWQKKADKSKEPILFTPISDDIVGIAALLFKGPKSPSQAVILTTAANSIVAPVHDRMPVLVCKENWEEWISGEREAMVSKYRIPFPASQMNATPVDPKFNNARYKGAASSNSV